MLKFFINSTRAALYFILVWIAKLERWDLRPRTRQIKKAKITQVALKEGESYRLGECIVTLAKFGIEGKAEVAKKIEAMEQKRIAREKDYTERGEKIMLMNPEELQKFQVEEWIKQRKAFNEKKFYDNLRDDYQQNSIK